MIFGLNMMLLARVRAMRVSILLLCIGALQGCEDERVAQLVIKAETLDTAVSSGSASYARPFGNNILWEWEWEKAISESEEQSETNTKREFLSGIFDEEGCIREFSDLIKLDRVIKNGEQGSPDDCIVLVKTNDDSVFSLVYRNAVIFDNPDDIDAVYYPIVGVVKVHQRDTRMRFFILPGYFDKSEEQEALRKQFISDYGLGTFEEETSLIVKSVVSMQKIVNEYLEGKLVSYGLEIQDLANVHAVDTREISCTSDDCRYQ